MSPVRTLPSGRVGAYHVPVLLAEIEALLAGASTVLDCTLGGGGHTAALLERGMRVTGVDRDPRVLAAARERLADFERAGQFRALLTNYAALDSGGLSPDEHFDGILLDLGVSSHQFEMTLDSMWNWGDPVIGVHRTYLDPDEPVKARIEKPKMMLGQASGGAVRLGVAAVLDEVREAAHEFARGPAPLSHARRVGPAPRHLVGVAAPPVRLAGQVLSDPRSLLGDHPGGESV